MSEKEDRTTAWSPAAIIITLTLLVILLGGFGIVWSQSNAEPGVLPPSENVADPTISPTLSAELPFKVEPVMPQASISEPMVPTAVATSVIDMVPLPTPSFSNPVDNRLAEEAAVWNADLVLVDVMNTGIWQYEANSFIRPIALEANYDSAFLLDGGRVLSLSLDQLKPPEVLLAPGDDVGGVRVLEPLDLALVKNMLFVLDRAGDVYRLDLNTGSWELDRYDRPVEASSGHYFVALDVPSDLSDADVPDLTRTLLETNYKFAMQYGGDVDSLWNLPEGRSVDVSGLGSDMYVLQREMFDPVGIVTKYRDTRSIKEFDPQIEIEYPRQIVATETAVYVLDKNGERLLAVDPIDGKLLRLYQLPRKQSISVFALDAEGRILLSGLDRLYMLEQPDRKAAISGGPTLHVNQPHDPSFLEGLDEFSVPIGGSNITFRDFQMPGAPRHYRLGVHQGLDFYWQPGTKVLAAADGVVIRADLDYVPPTAGQLGAWWNDSQERGYTASDTLDDYLGRQVWIQHDEGLVSRYAHLSSIAPGITQGVPVARAQIIGEVGNSGSPASLESESADAHLHFELWLRDTFLGQFMRPIETREWVERIFASGN